MWYCTTTNRGIKQMKYFSKHNYWSFGIVLSQNKFCDSLYVEREFRIDFWKWSFGIVW